MVGILQQAETQYLEFLNLSRVLALSGVYREAVCNKTAGSAQEVESVSRVSR